jgi:arylformamidase
LRQSAAIVRAWGEDGVQTRYEEIDGANHFTVIAPLTDPNSEMCARLKQLADNAR